MNMTDKDWENVLEEQREAFNTLAEPGKPGDLGKPGKPGDLGKPGKPGDLGKPRTLNNPKNENQIIDFIRIHKTTAKAKFYVTHETMSEVHGFWCPNAAATERELGVLEVAHWCTIKIINFL